MASKCTPCGGYSAPCCKKDGKTQTCNDQQPCPMHDEWVHFRRALMERVYSMTVADLGVNLIAKRSLCIPMGTPAPTPGDD